MKKEISIERSEEQRMQRVLFKYLFKCFLFSHIFNSLRIVFQLKFSREFREVGGDKFKELKQF